MGSERGKVVSFFLDKYEQPRIIKAIAEDVPPYFAEYPLGY